MIASGALKVVITGFGIFGLSDHSTTTASKVNLFGAKTGHILGMRFGTKEDFWGCFKSSFRNLTRPSLL